MPADVVSLLADHVQAVVDALRAGMPEPLASRVGDGSPREWADGRWGEWFSPPYCFVSGLDGGAFDASIGHTYPSEVAMPVQITCVGESRRQADRVMGRVATILLDKANVTVPGRRVWRVRWEGPASARPDPDTAAPSLFYATPVVYVHTTT